MDRPILSTKMLRARLEQAADRAELSPPTVEGLAVALGRRRTYARVQASVAGMLLILAVVASALYTIGGSKTEAPPVPAASPNQLERAAVPWIDRETDDVTAGTHMDDNTANVDDCRATDLELSTGRGGIWQGSILQSISVKSLGSAACRFSPPQIGVVMSDGDVFPAEMADTATAVVLPPKAEAMIEISSQSPPCGDVSNGDESQVSRSLTVSLAEAKSVELAGTYLSVACGRPILTDITAPDLAPPDDRSVLEASLLRLPGTITPGAPIKYFVVLANPTDTAVSLQPCPSYSEGVKGLAPSTYQLNCSDVGEVPPQDRVAFEMQYSVPENARPDQNSFSWVLNVAPPVIAFSEMNVGVSAS